MTLFELGILFVAVILLTTKVPPLSQAEIHSLTLQNGLRRFAVSEAVMSLLSLLGTKPILWIRGNYDTVQFANLPVSA